LLIDLIVSLNVNRIISFCTEIINKKHKLANPISLHLLFLALAIWNLVSILHVSINTGAVTQILQNFSIGSVEIKNVNKTAKHLRKQECLKNVCLKKLGKASNAAHLSVTVTAIKTSD